MARALLGLELAIGVAILQPHFLKKVVVPMTIMLLVAFCIHLGIEMVKHGAMSGNCGCFGQLLPMTPLEAFVKNVITIALMVFIYKNVRDLPDGKNRFSVLWIILLSTTLAVFVAFPFSPCQSDTSPAVTESSVAVEPEEEALDATTLPIDSSLSVELPDTAKVEAPQGIPAQKVDSMTKASVPVDRGPAPVKSRFSELDVFSGKKVSLDKGKKIVCFFAPGCDHCREAAKALNALGKKPGFPPVYIYFMEEEPHLIPEFLDFAGKQFPYQVLDIPTFWTVIGPDGSTPGVFYQWNGNTIKYWVGTGEKEFKSADLLKSLEVKP
jgi:thiol-disulfide isomerase/thioredoxin